VTENLTTSIIETSYSYQQEKLVQQLTIDQVGFSENFLFYLFYMGEKFHALPGNRTQQLWSGFWLCEPLYHLAFRPFETIRNYLRYKNWLRYRVRLNIGNRKMH
jgi:hypothetical protein